MGIFSSKKKHYVDTQVMRVVEDELLPNSMQAAMVRSIFTDGLTVTDAVINEGLNGSYRNFERAYRYAKKDYFYGLPSARVQSSTAGNALVKAAIQSEINKTITMDYIHYRPINNIHEGWRFAVDTWKYAHQENELTALTVQKGYPVFLEKMVAVHRREAGNEPEVATLGNWGESTEGGALADPDDDSTLGNLTASLQTGIPAVDFDADMDIDKLEVDMEIKIGPTYTESVEIHWIGEEKQYKTERQLDKDGNPYKVKAASDGSVFMAQVDANGDYIKSNGQYVEFKEDELQGTWTYWPDGSPRTFTLNAYQNHGAPVLDPWGIYHDVVTEIAPIVRRGVHTVDLSAYDGEDEYYQARYHYGTGANEVEGYWTYKPNGTHEELDAAMEPVEFISAGTYFPITVFRSEKVNMSDSSKSDTEAHITSTKLLKYLGMDYQEMGDSLHENDDIKDIRQAVMMMGVPITTENQVEMNYLHTYFSELSERLSPPNDAGIGSGLNVTPDVSHAIDFADADFHTSMSFDGIEREIVAGSINDEWIDIDGNQWPAPVRVGTCKNELVSDVRVGQFIGKFNLGVATPTIRRIRKQVTEFQYEEIRIKNIKMRYHIARGKGAEGGQDDDRLLVPVDYAIARSLPFLQREELYYRSMHMVFNSHVVQKIKWYERGAFKALLIIVAVVITIWSLGTTWQAAVAAAGVGATTTAIVVVLVQMLLTDLVIGMAVQFALTELIELLGVEIGIVLAIVAVAASMYAPTAAPKGATGIMAHMTTQNLLMVSSGLFKGVQEELANMFGKLQSDQDAFNLMAEEKWSELEEAQKEMDTSTDLDPWLFVGHTPLHVWGEKPDSYYNRLTTQNPGAASIEIVQNFVKTSLRLPTIQDTIGDSIYG